MKLITDKDFETLANIREEHCITIYLPTHRNGEAVTSGRDALHFKNQLQRIKHNLQELGMTEAQAREYLQPAQRLYDDGNFWHHQLEGLAVFLSKNHFSYHRLPFRLEEFSCVSKSFHLLQLVPLMSGDGIYYILALSLEKVRLLEATRFYVNELDIDDRVQQGLKEVEKYYEFERALENQGGLVPNPQNRNGQGELRPTKKDLVEEYFRNVVVGLRKIILTERTPVVLAAVDYLHPIFKEAASGLNVMPQGLMGNPDMMKAKELHSKSWELVSDHFNQERERTRQAYGDWSSRGRTSYDVGEIVQAAHGGRIDTLFVGKGMHQWGNYNPDSLEVNVKEEFEYGDDCLVSRAAVQTILNGGNAYVVDKGELPGNQHDNKMTAMLRY